jgi:ABC-type multidrug transport system fused ATPase/permease subunit
MNKPNIGCGKSSIISMIERFYEPSGGEITFDGINIKDLNPRWYH